MKKISSLFFSLTFLFLLATPVFATGWTNEGNLSFIQDFHKSILLDSGKVLLTGGEYNNNITNHTQIYTYGAGGTGTWATKDTLNSDRKSFTLDLIVIDQLTGTRSAIVTGGVGSCSCMRGSSEIYDEPTNSWNTKASLNTARYAHGSSILSDGKLFVTGGLGNTAGTTKLSSTEIYDPTNDTWTTKASLNTGRFSHKQISFVDSGGNPKVMIIGGNVSTSSAVFSTEIYDPTNDTWSAGPSMKHGRTNFSAILLNDGRILVVGGDSPSSTNSEVYDPSTNHWTDYATPYATTNPQIVLLDNSTGYKVLTAGGTNPYTTNAMLFDPSNNTWSTTTSMNIARGNFTLTTLSNGIALAAAGDNSGGHLNSSETYTP